MRMYCDETWCYAMRWDLMYAMHVYIVFPLAFVQDPSKAESVYSCKITDYRPTIVHIGFHVPH